MKYKGEGKEQVRAWVYSEETVLYDFVEDTQTNLESNLFNDYHKLDFYEKFAIYKYKGSKPKWNKLVEVDDKKKEREEILNCARQFEKKSTEYQIGDPDSKSKLLQEVYKLLWEELAEQSYIYEEQKSWISSDTMTSAKVRLQDAMKKIISNVSPTAEELKKMSLERQQLIERIRMFHNAFGYGKDKWWTTNFCIIVEAVLTKSEKQEFYRMIDEHYPSMREFLHLWHTIGNYCPVPIGFNSARSNFGKHDYWDLTLGQIYQWYEYDENKKAEQGNPLVKLLHMDELLGKCTEWLRWFEKKENKKDENYTGWQNFVETLFLQDYLKDPKDSNSAPKPFWSESKDEPKVFEVNHDWKNPSLPNNEEAINKALQEINRRIIARSLRIVAACRKKLAEQENES